MTKIEKGVISYGFSRYGETGNLRGLYAIFDTPFAEQHNFVGIIRDSWKWIYQEWLPNSGYRRTSGFELESYIEASKKYSERIYVPLEKE